LKKVLSFVLCFVLLFVSTINANPNVAKAATKQELQEEINRLDGEIAKNREQLNNLAGKKEEQQKYLNTLESQISTVEQKAAKLHTQIETIDNEISEYDKQLKKLGVEIAVIQDEIKEASNQISETQSKISQSKDLLSKKLRASYINGKGSTLKILIGSENLASFLTSLELMKRMSEEDKKVIDEFKKQAAKLRAAKDKLEKSKATLDEKHESIEQTKALSVNRKKELTVKQSEYDASMSQLEKDYAKVEGFIAELDKNSAIYKSYVSKLQQEREAADREIDEIMSRYYASLTTTTVASTVPAVSNHSANQTQAPTNSHSETTKVYHSNDSWLWPLGGASCYISSGYGYRSPSVSGWGFHGGIDISTRRVVGVPIYASRGGRVITAVTVTNDPFGAKGKGYANYVIIDHGDGFATLYGHCWKVFVSSGQTVSKGQQIASVGSTGNSSGPHLHFEVRHNGVKQNPLNYVNR